MPDNIYILVIFSVVGIVLMVAGVILLQIRNKNRVLLKEKQIAAAEIAHQKDLLHTIISSQETERKRIGTDLHDEVGSVLSSLRMLIEVNHPQKEVDVHDSFNVQSKIMIDSVIKSMRQISHNLSPRIVGRFGLYDALQELCDSVRLAGTIQVLLEFREEDCHVSLNTNTAVAIYRVLAELINNTIKHAHASRISITINVFERSMQLVYTDDGTGFLFHKPIHKKGMGLQNIESRLSMIHATWQISPNDGGGFGIKVIIPFEQ